MENKEELKKPHLTDEELDNVNGGAIYGTGDITISGENVTYTDITGGASAGGIHSSCDVGISGENV